MKYVASRTEMQQIDAFSIEQMKIPGIVLMEKAAMAIEEEILARISPDQKILIVTEKGNNGGDGLALARLLHHKGYQADIYEVGAIPKASQSYQIQRDILKELDIPVLEQIPDRIYDVIVDAMFGVGLSREITGQHKAVIEQLNHRTAYKIAIDMPSGIDATSGLVLGVAFRADLTITIGLDKIGLLLDPGASYAGEIIVKDIGFPHKAVEAIAPKAVLYGDEDLALLPKRKAWSNKGTYGRILLIAGSKNMAGAAYLAGLAAYRAGAGLVRIFTCEENRQILQTKLPEAILTTYTDKNDALNKLEEALIWADVIGFGSGLGMNETTAVMLECILSQGKVPVILDADGINLLAKMKKNQDSSERAKRVSHLYDSYEAGMILTPHMKEMERLTGIKVAQLIENRLQIAKETADAKHIIVLKDARSLISDGSEEICINISGNHGMAAAGSGDVLMGIITALAAVEDNLLQAARLGAYVHGRAGDLTVEHLSHHSMMAEDLANGLQYVFLEVSL